MHASFRKTFNQKINLLNISENFWSGTKICQKKNLSFAPMVKKYKDKKKDFFLNFFKDKQPQLIKNGGWHLVFEKPRVN